MKIITISYALAFHDSADVTLDGLRDILFRAMGDGAEAEVIHNISTTERHVDIPDPDLDTAKREADPFEDWQASVWEQPEFQA